MEIEKALEKFRKIKKRDSWLDCIKVIYGSDKLLGVEYLKDFRSETKKSIDEDPVELMKLLKESYILTARDNFDDFMIAMEWDRQNKFWLPRRRVLEGQHGIASKLQGFMDGDGKKLTLSLPPGTGKSTMIKFLLSYVVGKYPDSMNMYISYADGMVRMVYDAVCDMINSEEYNFHQIFDIGRPDMSADLHTISYRSHGDAPTLGLVAVGGSVTGRTRANKLFVTDDLVKNAEVASSPERLEKLWQDYNDTLTTRQIGDDVKEIMLGTIWSIYDPISRTREKYKDIPGYDFIAIPVEDEDGHSNFNYDHPDRYSEAKIAELKRDLNPVTFSCLYMQRGIEKEGLAFSKDKLKYFRELPSDEPDKKLFHDDVAWGGGDSSSCPFAYIYGDRVYIADVMFDRGDKSVTRPRLVSKILKNRPHRGNFEANNGGSEYAEDIDDMLKKENYSMHITTKRAKGNMTKLSRIEQHQDTIREFYFLAPDLQDDEYKSFMSELNTFSFTTKNLHDDAADSLAGLCEEIYGGVNIAKIMKRTI